MFDRFESARRPSWKRRSLLIGSLVLHGAVALVLVAGSWFHVAELTPPPLAIVFFAHEPPPQGSTAPAQKTPKATHPPRAARQLTQPTTRTTAPPPTEATDEPGEPPSDQPPGTGPNGPPSTSPPCTGVNCNGPAAPAPKPRNLPPHALDAQRIGGATPHLPASVIGARRGLGDSTFTARLCVDQSGAISSVTVLSGIPGADSEIVSTLRNWRYKPQPIPVCFVTQLVYDVQ